MNKTLVITTIALVAVVMRFSTIAPTLQQAFAHDVLVGPPVGHFPTMCPADFVRIASTPGLHPDHNANGQVCKKLILAGDVRRNVVIDDILVRR